MGCNLLKSKLTVMGPVTVAVVEMSKARLLKTVYSVGMHGSVGVIVVVPGAVTFAKLIVMPPKWTVTFVPRGVLTGMKVCDAPEGQKPTSSVYVPPRLNATSCCPA